MPEITTLGSAAPGTVVASGSLITPAGDQGPAGSTGSAGAPGAAGPPGAAGLNAFNTTTAGFTVPPVGSTVTVTLNDASWVVVGQMIYCDQAGGGVGQAGALQVTAKTGNQITLLTPTPAPAIPNASSSGAGLLAQLSGNTTDFVDGTNTCQNLVTAVQPTIWSMRLRSFNAIGNPTFEVDQINVGNTVANANLKIVDRWNCWKAGTLQVSASQLPVNVPLPSAPDFLITRSAFRVTLTTAEPTLGVGDSLIIDQEVEGPRWRELATANHSISLLVRSSVGPLKFCVAIKDPSTTTKSLVKLCTIPSANAFVLIPLPNLPVFPGGNFSYASGVQGYSFTICLACGSNGIAPAADTWQNGNFIGLPTMDNFVSKPVNSTFDIAFVQHEPGAQCSTPIDCPFTQNYDECLRYYQKTYSYPTAIGTSTQAGQRTVVMPIAGWGSAKIDTRFIKPMAKPPVLTVYNPNSGAANSARGNTSDYTVSGIGAGDAGMSNMTFTPATSGADMISFHYIADTGW